MAGDFSPKLLLGRSALVSLLGCRVVLARAVQAGTGE